MAGGSKKKRAEPQEALSGSSLFLICTRGWLRQGEPGPTLFYSGVILSPFRLHSLLPFRTPGLLSFPTCLCLSKLFVPLCSHNTFCRPPQGSVLLFSESDSFSAALSSSLFQECARPFNNLRSVSQTRPSWSPLIHPFFFSFLLLSYLFPVLTLVSAISYSFKLHSPL